MPPPPLFNNVGSENLDSIPVRPESNLEGNGFGDDVNLICTGDNLLEMSVYMQEALDKQSEWGVKHGLKFNTDKTKVMIFTRRRNFDRPILTLDGKILEYVDSYKYLGVILDSKLNWKQHIKE